MHVGDGSGGGNEKGISEAITDDDLRANVKVRTESLPCLLNIIPTHFPVF
jgi:hypothetical protein